jgi:hypothetical protein
MKQPKSTIRIPEPCHEDWNKMAPTESGKFCQVCTKEVIDFTAKSDEEIIKHLQKYGNVCGRFHNTQLNRKLIMDRKKRNHWLSYVASLLLPMTLFSKETTSTQKNSPQTVQTETTKFESLHIGALQRAKASKATQEEKFTITGTITDDSGLPLPSATILIKGTEKGIIADFDGKYKLEVHVRDILVVSYLGFETKEIRVNANKRIYNVMLSQEIMGMIIGLYEVIDTEGADEYGYVSKYDKTHYPKPMTEEEIKARDERTKNYFAFQRKKWLDKRAKRREKRAAKKAKRNKQ